MPRFSRWCRRLLGTTCIVADLAAATAAWRESNGAFDFVTLAGDLLNRHGIYTGGYVNGNGNGKAAVVDSRPQKSNRRIADRRSRNCRNKSAKLSRRKGALQSEQTELQASLQQAQTELRTQEVAIATREGEFNALQNSQRAAAPEDRHGRLRNPKPRGAGTGRLAETRSISPHRVGELETRERDLQAAGRRIHTRLWKICGSSAMRRTRR